jgi:hypothetical protein
VTAAVSVAGGCVVDVDVVASVVVVVEPLPALVVVVTARAGANRESNHQ